MRYRIVLIAILSLFVILPSYAELLVVKRSETGELTTIETSREGQAIANIRLKYQWPMCIAAQLSEQEQNELLSSGKKNAQEQFIQNKIRAKLGEQYDVVFIPTALYELFFLVHCFKKQDKILEEVAYLTRPQYAPFHFQPVISLTPYIKSGERPAIIRDDIYDVYKTVNAFFFGFRQDRLDYQYNHDASLYVNNILVRWLFEHYPALQKSKDSSDFSNVIEHNYYKMALFLIDELKPLYSRDFPDMKYIDKFCAYELVSYFFKEIENNIIFKVMRLEYEARAQNKALLLRGTSFSQVRAGIGAQPEKKIVAGTTFLENNVPYSISLGNSLFAGILRDCGACVYQYLVGADIFKKPGTIKEPSPLRATGYALLIDKKAYYEHQISQLFFIAPLTTLAGLFQRGEYFHSRTKAAIIKKDKEEYRIMGIASEKLHDPAAIILINRNPLRHAELFSKFLAENGRVVQIGDMATFTPEERDFADKVKQSQTQVAKFYRDLRIATQKMKKWIMKKRRGLAPIFKRLQQLQNSLKTLQRTLSSP